MDQLAVTGPRGRQVVHLSTAHHAVPFSPRRELRSEPSEKAQEFLDGRSVFSPETVVDAKKHLTQRLISCGIPFYWIEFDP